MLAHGGVEAASTLNILCPCRSCAHAFMAQVWVDNLNPEFLEPALAEVTSELMHGLWALLRAHNQLGSKVSRDARSPSPCERRPVGSVTTCVLSLLGRLGSCLPPFWLFHHRTNRPAALSLTRRASVASRLGSSLSR
jgi:hypothetical protein